MGKASSLLFLALLAGSLAAYPLAGTWLTGWLLAYAALLLWRPQAWLFALPVLVPAVDLAPVTGWFYLEELDLFLMLTAGLCYWRPAVANQGRLPIRAGPQYDAVATLPPAIQVAAVLVTAACAISCVRGLLPLAPLDANAFSSYLSSYNALRVAKSWCWAVVLLPLLQRDAGQSLENLRKYFLPGVLSGLALVSAADLVERHAFPGLLNMASDYRTSAPFSGMHTGGAALDGYLALSIPLLAYWLGQRLSALKAIAGLALLALAVYATLTTFSRGLYLGLALSAALYLIAKGKYLARHLLVLCAIAVVALILAFATSGYRGFAAAAVILLASALLGTKQVRAGRHALLLAGYLGLVIAMIYVAYRHSGSTGLQGMVVAVSLACAVLAVQLTTRRAAWMPSRRQAVLGLSLLLSIGIIIPVAAGGFAGERVARASSDLSARLRHWSGALALMRHQPMDGLFGVGQGRFPQEYFWHNLERERPASFAYVNEGDKLVLRLAPPQYARGYGEVLRILQRVPLRPARSYVFSVDVRNAVRESFLAVHICERQLLYAQACIKLPVRLRPGAGSAWQRYLVPFQSGRLDGASLLSVIPVQLEIALVGGDARVDIDRVSIQDSQSQEELLRNGDFSNGSSYWFFSSDHHHLPWHVKNLLLSQYFDQGALGAAALILLLALVGGRLAARARQGERMALAYLAALAAFLVVGQFDTLLDVPRIALLFYFYLFVASMQAGPAPARRGS
jgi:hypothetical protein